MAVTNPRARGVNGAQTPVVALKSDHVSVRTARLQQNASGRWEIKYSERNAGGRGYRSRTQSTHTTDPVKAQRELDRFIEDVIAATQERDQGAVTPGQLTVAELCESYGRARPAQQPQIRPLVARFGHVRLGEITPELVRAYRTTLAGDGLTEATARRHLGVLKAAINHARREGRTNMLPYIELPKSGAPRTRWLTKDQLSEVWGKLGQFAARERAAGSGGQAQALRVFLFIAATWGARRGAIQELTWDRVDFAHRTVDFRNPAKPPNRKRRPIVHMTDEAAEFLAAVWEQAGRPTGGRVVQLAHDALKYWVRKFFAEIGMPWVTAHVFRHTVATHLLQEGHGIYQVGQVLADTEATIRANYAHCLPGDQRTMLEGRRLGV